MAVKLTFFYSAYGDKMWTYGEDVAGKFGWYTNLGATHPGNRTLSFPIKCPTKSRGWVGVDVLHSYKNAGRVKIWAQRANTPLQPDAKHHDDEITIGTRWSSHTSQYQTHYVSCPSVGVVNATLQIQLLDDVGKTEKVKVTGVSVCS